MRYSTIYNTMREAVREGTKYGALALMTSWRSACLAVQKSPGVCGVPVRPTRRRAQCSRAFELKSCQLDRFDFGLQIVHPVKSCSERRGVEGRGQRQKATNLDCDGPNRSTLWIWITDRLITSTDDPRTCQRGQRFSSRLRAPSLLSRGQVQH